METGNTGGEKKTTNPDIEAACKEVKDFFKSAVKTLDGYLSKTGYDGKCGSPTEKPVDSEKETKGSEYRKMIDEVDAIRGILHPYTCDRIGLNERIIMGEYVASKMPTPETKQAVYATMALELALKLDNVPEKHEETLGILTQLVDHYKNQCSYLRVEEPQQ